MIFVFLLFLVATTTAQTNIWDGTVDTTWFTNNKSATEYAITTPQQLAGFARLINGNNGANGNGNYTMEDKTITLGNDIVLNDTDGWEDWETNSPANSWTAIAHFRSFKGTFDGNGYTVSGVYINTTGDKYGLFGALEVGGTIKNLSVVKSYIKGGEHVGCLVGNNSGTVSNSYAACTVIGENYVGGLAGDNGVGIVRNSYSTSTVIGDNVYVGGLVGMSGSSVINNYTVSNSYYDKETSGQTDTGKGEGKTTAEMKSLTFANNLNLGAGVLSMNTWDYSEGEYPVLSNEPAVISIASYFADGEGTETNPYIIETKEHLEYLSFFTNLGKDFSGEYFKLGNNIALNDTINWQNWETTPPANTLMAIGPFNGTFDGSDYVVSGLYINIMAHYQGLFGSLREGGTIKNLGVVNHYIEGSYHVGSIVGDNDGKIINSYSIGTVIGGSIGGLVGDNDGEITNSYFTGTVAGNDNTGGLIGINNGKVNDSYFTGIVTGRNYIGGLVGSGKGKITNSYSTGTVTGTGDNVGGLVGYGRDSVSNSYSTGAVTGRNYVGGLIGYNYDCKVVKSYSTSTVTGNDRVGGLIGYTNNGATVSNSYSAGAVTGETYVGGLVGYNDYGTPITNSYSTGAVTGNNYIGGLIGYNIAGTISNSYYDKETSELTDIEDTGKTTEEMKLAATYVDWDFENIWKINSEINNGYPYLDIITITPITNRTKLATGGATARVIGNAIVLTNLPQNAKVDVYGLNGKRVYAGVRVQNFEPLRITVQTKGIYIMRVGNQTLRVAVR